MTTVAHILSVKGRDVVTTQPHRTIAEVANLLAEKGIGAVLVSSANSEILGILSERDIVRAIAHGGAASLNDAVSRHMTTRLITTSLESSVTTVMEQMTEGRFRHMPVLTRGHLSGIISIGDVVKHRIAEIETEHQALREYIASA